MYTNEYKQLNAIGTFCDGILFQKDPVPYPSEVVPTIKLIIKSRFIRKRTIITLFY